MNKIGTLVNVGKSTNVLSELEKLKRARRERKKNATVEVWSKYKSI